MEHTHHTHTHTHSANKHVLWVSLIAITLFMLLELVGGYFANSLALLSDAGHMFSDAFALGLSLLAFYLSDKPVSRRKTFGYKRFEIVAAAFNALALLAVALWIVVEAVERLYSPPHVATGGMLAVGVLGLAVNVFVAWYMHRQADIRDNVNMRSAFVHVLGDLLGSVGAVAAALLMMGFGWGWADAVVSMLMAVLIVRSGWDILKTATHILMEGAPDHMAYEALLQEIAAVPGVLSAHDLHVWTITSGEHALSCHVVVDGNLTVHEAQALVRQVEVRLAACHIGHTTVQIESPQHGHDESALCSQRASALHRHAHAA